MVCKLDGLRVEWEAEDSPVFGRDLDEELGGLEAQLDGDCLDERNVEPEDLLVVKIKASLQDRVEVALGEEEMGACLAADVLYDDAKGLKYLLGHHASSVCSLVVEDSGQVAHHVRVLFQAEFKHARFVLVSPDDELLMRLCYLDCRCGEAAWQGLTSAIDLMVSTTTDLFDSCIEGLLARIS